MEKWRIILDFSIAIYCVIAGLQKDINNINIFIITILIYINMKLVIYIIDNRKIKLILSILSLIFVFTIFNRVNEICILLIPSIICLISEPMQKEYLINIIALTLLLFFIPKELLSIFIFDSIVTLIIYCLTLKHKLKIQQLTKENDFLRHKNFDLINKIDKEDQYIKQTNYMTTLEERNKIAQEIHDNIGHTLAGSLMQLEAAKLMISEDTPKQMIDNTIKVLREGMDSIRSTLKSIKPKQEEFGVNKIKLELDKFSSTTNIATNLLFHCDLESISFNQWKVICENLKEALTNITKYSEASKVFVDIKKFNKFLRVEIKDDGVGACNIKKGMGIRGMEERVESLGGKIVLNGIDGFSIIMILPL